VGRVWTTVDVSEPGVGQGYTMGGQAWARVK
jgi:hypothetical protein